ncbi:hypothetical protein J3459_014651 [Metarhizium acridum]|nr:hypothetical protein J3459_014651 [Metarhizium acridum]
MRYVYCDGYAGSISAHGLADAPKKSPCLQIMSCSSLLDNDTGGARRSGGIPKHQVTTYTDPRRHIYVGNGKAYRATVTLSGFPFNVLPVGVSPEAVPSHRVAMSIHSSALADTAFSQSQCAVSRDHLRPGARAPRYNNDFLIVQNEYSLVALQG